MIAELPHARIDGFDIFLSNIPQFTILDLLLPYQVQLSFENIAHCSLLANACHSERCICVAFLHKESMVCNKK